MSFSNRHIGIDKKSEKIMLDYLGVNNTETLIKETIPHEIRLKKDISWHPLHTPSVNVLVLFINLLKFYK